MRNELLVRLEELGNRTAGVDGDVPYSYRDLADEIRRLEQTLESHRVRPHDVVVLNEDFSFLSIAALLALYLNRNVLVPVVSLTETTLATVIESCSPQHIIRVDEGVQIDSIDGAVPAA